MSLVRFHLNPLAAVGMYPDVEGKVHFHLAHEKVPELIAHLEVELARIKKEAETVAEATAAVPYQCDHPQEQRLTTADHRVYCMACKVLIQGPSIVPSVPEVSPTKS